MQPANIFVSYLSYRKLVTFILAEIPIIRSKLPVALAASGQEKF